MRKGAWACMQACLQREMCCGQGLAVACIVMAYIVMAYIVMAYIVMARYMCCGQDLAVAYIVMAYVVIACIVMAYIVMAYIVMARYMCCGQDLVAAKEVRHPMQEDHAVGILVMAYIVMATSLQRRRCAIQCRKITRRASIFIASTRMLTCVVDVTQTSRMCNLYIYPINNLFIAHI